MIFDDTKLRAMIKDAVREVVREELGRAPGRDEYIDVADAARIASACHKTIRAWIAEGRLTEYRVGRGLRVKRSELDAAMSAGRSPPEPEMAALAYVSKGRKAG